VSAVAADDRERWDERHARAAPSAPDAFVLTALERLAPAQGRALDLAAGTGRHALLLAERGYEVDAWDVSPVGLAILSARAREARLPVRTRAVDLVGAGAPASPPWDLVVVCNYLDRGLLGELARWVRPGGHVLFTTFTVERAGTRPPLERCLRRGELSGGLPGLVTEHGFEEGGRAGILARRPGDAAAGLRPGRRR
jgi:SAM-dependent methyltransferase